MIKYKVKVTHLFSEVFDIEAENEKEAREKTHKILEEENRLSNAKYEATLPEDSWPAINIDDYNNLVSKIEQELQIQKEKK